jgi:hypothetical protein
MTTVSVSGPGPLNYFARAKREWKFRSVGLLIAAAALLLMVMPSAVLAQSDPFLPLPVRAVSTIPGNGDVNPYGVAFVPPGFPSGTANTGDVLVSNFNNSSNLQGTGTTIIDLPFNGQPQLFFQGQPGLGLTTALNILRKGFVLVGNFPSPDGSCTDSGAGSILVIDKNGNQIQSIANKYIQGPWDSALLDLGNFAELFVANGLSGTVIRIDLLVTSHGVVPVKTTTIASGYQHQCDPVTFVDAPTGLVIDPIRDVLYVASTMDNEVFAVPNAVFANEDHGTGAVIYSDPVHLHGALAMTMAPNGHLLVSNNDAFNSDPTHASEITEFTVTGQFVKQLSIDPSQGGAFGLAVEVLPNNVAQFAAVDDVTNNLLVWTLPAF